MQSSFSFAAKDPSSPCLITRLTESDVTRETDHWLAFRNLILTNEDSYPGIHTWLTKKVAPSLSSTRNAYVAYIGEKPIASAVLKRGHASKFCHLKIHDNFQDIGLGDIIFSLMALDVRSVARRIHFTLPESLWESRRGFFESFGFTEAAPARNQYRLFERELECSAPYSVVTQAVMGKLPGVLTRFSLDESSTQNTPLLMSIRPQYIERILLGSKRVEIRRVFSPRWTGYRVALYASDPLCSLVGEAKIAHVVPGSPQNVWDAFGPSIGGTKSEFDAYVGTSTTIFAIVLDDVQAYGTPIKRKDITQLIGQDLRPPQSYMTLTHSSPWAQAVAIAEFQNGRTRRSMLSV